MITIGRCIRRLNGNFDLVPQPGHPDGCGGLEPLGHLSLLNALIISIWGVFLGGWIILGPSTKYGDFYTSLYLSLVPVPVFMAVLCFALPLWGVHDTMSAQMEIFRRGIDRLGHQVDRLSRELVEGAALLEPDEMGRMKGRLEIMDEVYKKNQTFPVWPFNNNILIRFLTSQAVPLLGLTGLGKPIVDMISILADFLGQL